MVYAIRLTDLAADELDSPRAHDRVRILKVVKEQLLYQPTTTTRNRKQLDIQSADFEFSPPIWELRVGAFRLFYDVVEESATVFIRAVRCKGPENTTEDILHERNNP